MTSSGNGGDNKKNDRMGSSPFRVLGIAMVIDQLGKEARMAFRYPTSVNSGINTNPLNPSESSRHHHHHYYQPGASSSSAASATATTPDSSRHGGGGGGMKGNEELFFSLSSRQMAKLFRPKHSLCGQPMTLSVGGTVFCFRAILMGEPSSSSSAATSGPSHQSTASGSGGANATTSNHHHEQQQQQQQHFSSSASITSANTQSTNNSINNNNPSANNSNTDHLVLFSVIVALAPQVDLMSSMPISGWYEQGQDDDKSSSGSLNQSMHRLYSSSSMGSSEQHGGCGGGGGSGTSLQQRERQRRRESASFLAIRRVHVSLARLCRVLEREENRCRYISIQSHNFFRIRSELQKKWDEQASLVGGVGGGAGAGSSSSKPPPSGSSPKTDFSSKGSIVGSDRKNNNHHRRGNSFSLLGGGGGAGTIGIGVGDGAKASHRSSNSGSNDILGGQNMSSTDKEQEILEHVLASGPLLVSNDNNNVSSLVIDEGGGGADQQHGNLGRELVQVFHALSRNDHSFPPSPSVLSGRDGIVYVNRHIAVAVEAASLPKTQSPENISNTIVRPYHTLIFPNASPSQLLQSLQSSGFTAPLQQLLLMVRPSKPLVDIAVDANLPLSVTMELANYLVGHGACVASAVLTRASRLACKNVDRIKELALDFSQTFDDYSSSLFLIVSFLTTNGRTLGESMAALTTGDDEVGSFLRSGILSSMFHETDCTTDDYIFVEKTEDSGAVVVGLQGGAGGYDSPAAANSEELKHHHHQQQQQQPQHQMLHPRAEELEEVLYSMAIWLLSHQVLGHIQDYLVLPNSSAASIISGPNATNVLHTNNSHFCQQAAVPGHFPLNYNAFGDRQEPADNNKDNKSENKTAAAASEPSSEASNNCDDSLLLLRELQESDCLNGNASIVAISWRLNLDEEKLRSWALRHDKLRIVSRIAALGDDWGAV